MNITFCPRSVSRFEDSAKRVGDFEESLRQETL